MLRTEAEIRAEIAELRCDKRLAGQAAQVQINAGLALVQLSLKERIRALYWVLDEALPSGAWYVKEAAR